MREFMFKKWLKLYRISWLFHIFAPVILSQIIDITFGIRMNSGLSWIIFTIILLISVVLLNTKFYDHVFSNVFNDDNNDVIAEFNKKISGAVYKIKLKVLTILQ